jgi:hypothetical protein
LELPVNWKTSFFAISLYGSLCHYVKKKITTAPGVLTHETGIPLLGFTFLSKLHWHWLNEDLELLENLLALGADPNQKYEGYTLWQYWVHYIHSIGVGRWNASDRGSLKSIFRCMLNCGVDLDVHCIKDPAIWSKIYREERITTHIRWRHNQDDLSYHAGGSSQIGGGTLERLFEERHSLVPVITDLFNTEDDPHGADELLEYIATLKAQKASGSHGGTNTGPKRKKRNRKKGGNSKV